MQVSMRTSQRKTVKKGRKAKKSKKGGTKGGKKGSKKSPAKDSKRSKKPTSEVSQSNAALSKSKKKLEILKLKKKKSSHADSSAPAQLPEAAAVEPKKRSNMKRKAKEDGITTYHSYQERVDLGNGKWRYQVLEDQYWGCSNCRFIYGGCKLCWNPKFKGRTAADVRGADSNKSDVSTSCVKGKPKQTKPKRKGKNTSK